MKRYFLNIFLSSVMLLPLGFSAEARTNNNSNYHRTTTERGSSNSRPGGNSNSRPNGNGNMNGRPGGNNNRPGGNVNNNNRPGGNKDNFNKDHGNKHDNDRWGGNSHNRPGGSMNKPNTPPPGPANRPGTPPPGPKPGHHPGWGWNGSSAHAPGYVPRPPHPHLGNMVNYAIRGGRYDNVWMVAPGQYAVRFYRNGYYYMQYLWPETRRYGTPFRIVLSSPGQWYAYDNCNQWFYDDGNSLRISLNGSPMNPWTLIPSVELNINF